MNRPAISDTIRKVYGQQLGCEREMNHSDYQPLSALFQPL